MEGERERLKRLLEVRDDWILAALYSDPEVSRINDRLLKRWREAGMRGDPLDYATDDEVRRLMAIAKRYIFLRPEEARAIALGRMRPPETTSETEGLRGRHRPGSGGFFSKISRKLKRAFSRGA